MDATNIINCNNCHEDFDTIVNRETLHIEDKTFQCSYLLCPHCGTRFYFFAGTKETTEKKKQIETITKKINRVQLQSAAYQYLLKQYERAKVEYEKQVDKELDVVKLYQKDRESVWQK